MTNLLTSKADKTAALELADTILERLQSDRLTRVPLLHLDELPALSGVYLATTDDRDILYIGKADDFTNRCKLSQHHKLPTAVKQGATYLLLAKVPERLAWAVEQRLIDKLAPSLNDSVSRWWNMRPQTSRSGRPQKKKINFRLPDGLADVLELWAEKEGSKPTSIATALLEQGIRQAMANGIAPSFEEVKKANIND